MSSIHLTLILFEIVSCIWVLLCLIRIVVRRNTRCFKCSGKVIFWDGYVVDNRFDVSRLGNSYVTKQICTKDDCGFVFCVEHYTIDRLID